VVFEWEVRTSIAGLVTSSATTSSECIIAIQTPVLVDFDNTYPRYPEGKITYSPSNPSHPPTLSDHSHTASILADTSNEPNYLGLLTLACAYVLSAYWSAAQQGTIRYTDHKATCNSSIPGSLHLGSSLRLDASSLGPNELRWWQAVLAPGRGWDAAIHRQGQMWRSPWTIENHSKIEFVIV